MTLHRPAYTDLDSHHDAIDQAIRILAPSRGCDPDPDTLTEADLLHLLASLILHAQTCLHFTIEARLPHFAESFQPDLAIPAFSGAHGVQREGFELVSELA